MPTRLFHDHRSHVGCPLVFHILKIFDISFVHLTSLCHHYFMFLSQKLEFEKHSYYDVGLLGGCYMTAHIEQWGDFENFRDKTCTLNHIFLQMQHTSGSKISLREVPLLCCLGARACKHNWSMAGFGWKNGRRWQFIAETLQIIQIQWNNKALVLYTALPHPQFLPLHIAIPVDHSRNRAIFF